MRSRFRCSGRRSRPIRPSTGRTPRLVAAADSSARPDTPARRRSAGVSVMQFDLPDGVVKATSSPSCVVVPSRVAGVERARIGRTSRFDERDHVGDFRARFRRPGGGRRGRRSSCAASTSSSWPAPTGRAAVCSASPPTPCEQPPTSTDAAISTAIRISARLAGRQRDTGQARRGEFVRYGRFMHEHVVRATTSSGTVEGFTRDGVHRWRSIPFAQPPVGPLRFQAPRPVQPWPGVRYCHGFGELRSAAAHVHRAGRRQVPVDGRGLPDAERHHAEDDAATNRCR